MTPSSRHCVIILVLLLGAATGCARREVVERDSFPTTPTTTTASTTPGTTIRVEVIGGRPTDGARREQVTLGDQVAITVISDVADEVHLHGYDLRAPAGPGQPATITFTADKPGVWEVELEDSGVKLLDLEVRPG